MDTERVRQGTSEDLRQLSPVIKALGSEQDLIRGHQSQAAKGDAFLLAYAPSDLDTQRLIERRAQDRLRYRAQVRPVHHHQAVARQGRVSL